MIQSSVLSTELALKAKGGGGRRTKAEEALFMPTHYKKKTMKEGEGELVQSTKKKRKRREK